MCLNSANEVLAKFFKKIARVCSLPCLFHTSFHPAAWTLDAMAGTVAAILYHEEIDHIPGWWSNNVEGACIPKKFMSRAMLASL